MEELEWAPRAHSSWVYGVSEVEIEDFARLYESTLQEVKNTLSRMETGVLEQRLARESNQFPRINPKEFVIDTGKPFWFLAKTFRPLKTIEKSTRLRQHLQLIGATCERMISYWANAAWLDMEAHS